MKIQGNTILVTGGNSGIGRGLAIALHDAGNQVIVTGRRADALAALAADKPGIATYVLDVTDAGAIAAFARRVVAEHPRLNVLVNNAGIMRNEDVSTARDLADAEETIATNLLGPIRLTNALVDHLRAQPDAAILNVSSGLAFVPMAVAATYCATKAAIHSYTQSLRTALAGRIEVIEIVPPAVQTELTPGQSTRAHYMPLDAYLAETVALLQSQPTPPEVLVERVLFLRRAEAEGRFGAAMEALNGQAH